MGAALAAAKPKDIVAKAAPTSSMIITVLKWNWNNSYETHHPHYRRRRFYRLPSL